MNLSAVKLVVFDMDGTLLNHEHKVSDRFYRQYDKLKDKSITFVAASGRQLQSIRHTLKPIQDEISIIGENGSILQHAQETRTLLQLDLNQVMTCIETLRQIENTFIVLCGKKAAYIDQNDPEFLRILKNYYHVVRQVVDLKTFTGDDFLKIAVYHFESSEKHIYPYVQKLKNDLKIIVSAKHWLDISHQQSNKGYALELLQNTLGVSEKQTLVFGDYNNDIEMLQRGAFSVAMENAHPNVKAVAKYTTKSNTNEGVEHVLDRLIESV